MKLSHAILIIGVSLPSGCQAFLPNRLSQSGSVAMSRPAFLRVVPQTLLSSTTNSDAAFSAFADSLEDEIDIPSRQRVTTKEKSWQAKLEDLLDPKTNLAERQILLSELLNSNEQIQQSVMEALANRKIDPLLTPTAAKLQDGTRAVVRQIANDILPQISKTAGAGATSSQFPFAPPSPAVLEKTVNRLFDLVSNQIQNTAKEFQEDLTDPLTKIPQRLSKQREELVQEARNVFLETPEGLKEPPYTLVESCDIYEIRDYDGYSVASTVMPQGEDVITAGSAFNTLAAYLFGENQESKAMAMTTPVTTTSLGEMRFYLAEPQIPLPLEADKVDIMTIPPARLAVRKFTGFATDGEIARQKDTLLQALEMDGVELDVDHGAIVPHVVFQYNPPYTLPIVRRNEIAVPVRPARPETISTSLKEEWSVDDENDEEDISPSDVDS